MCEPVTIMTIATIASAAVGAYSSIQAGNAEYKVQMYNAQIAERNAQAAEDEQANVKDAAAIERRRLGERVRAERGQYIVNATASGIDPGFGTPADLIGDINQAYAIDRSILGKNEITALGTLDKQVADFRDSAAQSRAAGKGALKAGRLGAVSSILDGASNVAGKWITPTSGTTRATAQPARFNGFRPPPKPIPVGG